MSQKVSPRMKDPSLRRNNVADSYDFYTCPLRVVSCLAGVWPFRMKRGQYMFSQFFFIYGVLLVGSTSVYRIYIEPKSKPGFIYQVMRLKNLLTPVSTLICLAVLSAKVKKVVIILNSFYSFRYILTMSQLKLTFCIQVVLIAFGVLSYFFLTSIFFLLRADLAIERLIVSDFLDLYMIVSLYFVKLQFFFGIFFLKNLLVFIRKKIAGLENLRPCSFSSHANDVTEATSLYDDVMNQAEAMNECFGLGLGVVTLSAVCNCFTTGYFYFVIQESGIDWYLFVWLVLDLAQIWLVLTATEWFIKETSLIAMAVHKALRIVNNGHIIKQLKQFSIYLLHRRPRFTLCGMVALDYSLFFTIAGAVATYIVVLVQFQKTEGNSLYNMTTLA